MSKTELNKKQIKGFPSGGYLEKPESFTSGHIVEFDGNGNGKDSGTSINEVASNEAARQAAEAARVAEEARRMQEYGQFEFDINTALNCIEGQNDIPFFDEDTDYFVGQYVRRIPEGGGNQCVCL